jgi:DNA-directed RNA polymerase subunit RPC12/RpoP
MQLIIKCGNIFPVHYGAYDIYLSFFNGVKYHRPINEENSICPLSQKLIDDLYHHCSSCKKNFDSVVLNKMCEKTNKTRRFDCPMCHSEWDDYRTYRRVP